jgi:hypothetical protein
MFHKQHMTTGSWLLFFFLMAIPMVNLVVGILILIDRSYNPSLRNFIKAYLVILIIGLMILFGLWGIIMEILRQAIEESDQVTIALVHSL